ncbi:hypothetical protein BELL_0065g00150 [Botrytis elliptica]|uniref:Uncharacterized protein n=1 Tax=Botrytis elliptica TaxID=278938 RepID=A0A4Z1KAQ3_9HELO|nr:hypothetical protein BELL_0065g00150 [Botrytis elliptica]
MDNRKMWEAEYHQRQRMRLEHEKKMLEHKEKILESFRHQLENINIYAKRYGDSMSCYIENPDDFWVQLMDVERVKIISGLRELKLKQERHPKELTELVTQVVASFEDLVGVNLGFEERVEKYKRENNTLKARKNNGFHEANT